MSILSQIEITGLRNITKASFSPSPHINLFYGENASGKTTVLEAVHLLSLGRSFRTQRSRRLIQDNSESAIVFAKLTCGTTIGIQKTLSGESITQIDRDRTVRRGELAKVLPLQLFDPSTLEMLSGPSEPRRQLLDWGVFHVEHGFLHLWQQYRHALLQRNSLLKSAKISSIELDYWEANMAALAQPLTEYRHQFFNQWKLFFDQAVNRLLPDENITMHLSTGWDEEASFVDLLRSAREKDNERGFTQIGPQRADVRVRVGSLSCEERLSRGQQKLAVCAMKLSVVELLINQYGVRPVLLLDDIASELDGLARQRVCDWISSLGVQVFATAIELNQLSSLWGDVPIHRFHVEHGDISNVTEAVKRA